jgi:chromosomal replication initiator protein
LDGTAVVNGIFAIPLAGRVSGSSGAQDAPAFPLKEFVAGPENRLAAFALKPFLDRAPTYASPLVLHGPHGAGKSHLAHGLADWWQQRFPEARVRWLPAGELAREHAQALDRDGLEAWRRELCRLDLLVLEDLGQLAGKRSAQHELVLVLDALADREALVVVTARTLPTHWEVLSPALRGRLSAGLAVGVSLPGPATRRAILERVAAARRLMLSKRTVNCLADGLNAGVPTLVSAVMELELRASGDRRPLDIQRVRELITQRDSAPLPSLREIASSTARYFGLTVAEIKGPGRRQPVVAGRRVVMYLARQLAGKSFGEIGAYLGGRDHTTVLYGCRRAESLLRSDRATRQAVAELKRLLNAS